jgi:hypothetical protein
MQYPTIGQPQYGFAPTMPGMAGGGLAALANQYRRGGGVRYFEEGGDSATGGADSSTEGGAGASGVGGVGGGGGGGGGGVGGDVGGDVGGGGNEAGVAAAAAAQGVDNAVAAAQDAEQNAAAEATLGAQVAAEADEAEAENAATTAAALGAQANAIAAEIANQQEENAKAETMAAAMKGELAGFPGPQAQAAPGFGFSLQNPLNTNIKEAFGLFNPLATVTTPIGKADFSIMDFAAPAMGKGASAVNSAVNAGKALGFAEGGLAAAQQTQSKGRGQDTMLVHMTPGEVKGLQALAMSQGGSLTINPQTGLPEAGFLSAILPMVAGFALGPAGFQMMSALQAGLTVGALTGVATGSLKKGLMAGLGAYGGAGLGQGLQAAAGTPENLISANPPYNPDLLTTYGPPPTTPLGIGSEGASVSAGAYTPTPGMAPNVMPPDVASGRFVDEGIAKAGYTYDPAGKSLIKMTPDAMPPDVASGRFVDEGIAKAGYTYDPAGKSLIKTGPVPGSGGQALGSVAKDTTYAQLPPPPPVQATGIDAITGGTKAMIQPGAEGAAARAKFGAALPYGTTIAAGVPLASAAAEPPKGPEPSKSYIRGYDLDITNPSGTPQYTPQDTREREQVRYAFSPRPIYEAAQGGQINSDYNMAVDQNGAFSDNYKEGGLSALAKRRKALAGDKYYKFAQDRKDSSMEAAVEQNFAKGGMKGALPPRFLQGDGDGMSDSIKARIGGVQEARLADGEFVIPADVVSHLGNGSSKAGAKKLYSMMDKIRKARTGRTRQAPEVNPNKYMPA